MQVFNALCSRRGSPPALCALALVVAALSGCGNDGDGGSACNVGGGSGTGLETSAVIGVEDLNGTAKDRYSFDTLVLANGKRSFPFTIRNNASPDTALPLKIKAMRLIERDNAGKEVATPAFRCETTSGEPCAGATFPEIVPPNFDKACAADDATQSVSFTIVYEHSQSGGKARKLTLEIDTEGDPTWLNKPLTVRFEASPGQPRLSCSGAEVIDFGSVGAGKGATQSFKCLSTGSAAVVLERVELFSATDAPLTIRFAGQSVTTAQAYEGQPVVEVPSGEALSFEAELGALDAADKETATLRIVSNSAGSNELKLQIVANSTGPCIKLSPTLMTFGDVPLAAPKSNELQITGCGTAAVDVVAITMAPGSSSDFSLDFATASFADAKPPSADAPLTVQPNANEAVVVRFSPSAATTEPVTGQVRIETSDGVVRTVDVSGRGTELACPVACIDPAPSGLTVVPQTKLKLTSACSAAAEGHVVDQWEWTVEQPSGSKAAFSPNAKQPVVNFTPNVAGTYVFKLTVYDEIGAKSCETAKVTYDVVPDNKLHVELTWTTEGDADPLDDKGTDLDLHIAHPLAVDVPGQKDIDGNGEPDPWYAQCYDSFWLNKKPEWGDLLDLDDNPTVDLDDDDGWGPENVNIKWPELNTKYWIGVYAWTDNGFGASKPRIRVYLDQKLVFDKVGPDMKTADMWCVGRVLWNPDSTNLSGDIEPCPGADKKGNLLTGGYPSASPSQTWTCK